MKRDVVHATGEPRKHRCHPAAAFPVSLELEGRLEDVPGSL
jgi:hypothetical protein